MKLRDEINILRDKLNTMLLETKGINKEEIIKLSQELDKLIVRFYLVHHK